MKHKAPPLTDMPGMWRRALIIHADGSRDASSHVRWLQAQSLYIDLRQAGVMPDFLQLDCLDDLTAENCAQLALQEGFAGRLGFDGECFEWQRLIDFQPRCPLADAGRLWWEEEVLIEAGRDVPYVEHWRRDPTVVTRPLAALRLHEPQTDLIALAVHVGTVFMYARARSQALPSGSSLAECVAGAASLEAAREMLDCEITLGSAGFGGNVILASTHPWRVAGFFQLHCAASTVSIQDVDPAGHPITRRWEVLEAEGDPQTVWSTA